MVNIKIDTKHAVDLINDLLKQHGYDTEILIRELNGKMIVRIPAGENVHIYTSSCVDYDLTDSNVERVELTEDGSIKLYGEYTIEIGDVKRKIERFKEESDV
jgi:hypothetical protein